MENTTIDKQRLASQLEALSFLRKRQGAHLNTPILFILFGLFALIAGILRFGADATLSVVVLLASAIVFYRGRGGLRLGSKWSANQRKVSDDVTRMEERLLRSFVKSTSSILRFRMGAPDVSQALKKSNLLDHRIDYVSQARSIVGADRGIPFCAVFIEAGVYEFYRDSDGVSQQRNKAVFEGLFMIVDCFEPPVGLTLSNQQATMVVQDQTLAMLLPMTVNPFIVRDNPELWPSELARLHETALMISRIVHSIAMSSDSEIA